MEQQNLTLTEAINSPQIKLLAKQRIQRFKDKAFQQIQDLNLIDSKQVQPAKQKKAS